MIVGSVSPDSDALIEVYIQDASGQVLSYKAVVDTGYTGWLTLPPDVIVALGLTWRKWGEAILADGTLITFNVYNATVVWDGQAFAIPIDEADAEPLVGMKLMQGYRILIEDVDGGLVQIEHL